MIIFIVQHASSADEEVETIKEIRDRLSENGEFTTMSCVEFGQVYTCFMTSQRELAKQLVKRHNQDVYLEKGERGFWYLISTHTDSVIKTFTSVGRITAEKAKERSSFFVSNGQHYVATEYRF